MDQRADLRLSLQYAKRWYHKATCDVTKKTDFQKASVTVNFVLICLFLLLLLWLQQWKDKLVQGAKMKFHMKLGIFVVPYATFLWKISHNHTFFQLTFHVVKLKNLTIVAWTTFLLIHTEWWPLVIFINESRYSL